jgi:hypothetical protein
MGPCLYPICWIGEGEACIDKHMAASSRFVAPSPLTLVAVVAAIVGISLSIHVVMLQVLWVPYPDTSRIGRLGLFYPLAQSLGLVALAAALLPWLRRFHPAARGPIVGLLFATMNGVLRNALMAGFATTDFRGSVGGFVQQGLFDLLLGTLAFAVVLAVRSTAVRLAAAVILAGVGTFWLNPALASLLGPLLAWSARHVRPDVYVVPYGPIILVPSYLLFAETVIACLLARYVITLRPAAWDPHGLFRYVGLVLLVRGVWVMMFVWGPIIGMLSVSQFFFQDLVMVLLIQLAWQRLGWHSASDAHH